MPELPEVETVCRGLMPVLTGHRILEASIRRGNLRIPFPSRFTERLKGRRVTKLARRAKYLLAELDDGETLVMHLGMSGRFTIHQEGRVTQPGKLKRKFAADGTGNGRHDHVILVTDTHTRLVYTDARRFGLMTLVPTAELRRHKLFVGLGPEPLAQNFNAATLRTALKGKRTPIKAALLDQNVVAGLGNIYTCEALHRAGIAPKREAASLSAPQVAALSCAIKAVLRASIKAGGSTLRDYAHADGKLGDFQLLFAVYDREGAPCPRKGCGGTIHRIVQGGRSTFYCPRCQH